MVVNEKDILLFSFLRENARMSLSKISRKTGIPVTTLFDSLKRNENGIIDKHTTLFDFSKMGYNTRANIMIKVDKKDRDDVKRYLVRNSSINSVYKINNGFDFMFEGIFKQIPDMENFFERLENKFDVKDVKYYYIINDLKREGFLANASII